jgi:hypothetical protein
VIQALYLRNSAIKVPLLGAVGPLQFEVVQFRLQNEYGAESRLEAAPWTVVRWLPADMTEEELDALSCRPAQNWPMTWAKRGGAFPERMVGTLFRPNQPARSAGPGQSEVGRVNGSSPLRFREVNLK